MKRLVLLIPTLLLVPTIFASVPAASSPTEISVPQLSGGGFYGVTGLYLQPSANNGALDYANLLTLGSGGITTNNIKSIDPSYEWGIGFNVGYIFVNSGNDIMLSYLHINTNDSTSITATDPENQFVQPPHFNDLELAANQGSGQVKYNVNQFDLTVGQYVNVGHRTMLHFIAGLRYANLDQTLSNDYAEIPADDFLNLHQKSNFEGIGPLAGVDGSYFIGKGFGVVGHFDSALLIGSINTEFDATHVETTGGTQETFTGNFDTGYSSRIVPVLDAKMGLNYTYLFNNATNSDLTFELGYQITEYFDAFDTAVSSFEDGIFAPVRIQTNDMGLQGPYISLTYHV